MARLSLALFAVAVLVVGLSAFAVADCPEVGSKQDQDQERASGLASPVFVISSFFFLGCCKKGGDCHARALTGAPGALWRLAEFSFGSCYVVTDSRAGCGRGEL